MSGTMGEGKVENGIYSGMIYRMQNDINLLHNKPWLVEWKGKSEAAKGQSQSLILLSESNSRKNYSADELEYFWLRCSESGKFYITLGKSNSIGEGAEAETSGSGRGAAGGVRDLQPVFDRRPQNSSKQNPATP